MTTASKRVPHGGYADRRFYRARIIGLIVACPYSQDNPAHCSLCRIRELPLAERYRWVTSLKLIELARIIDTHEHCLRATEQTGGAVLPPRSVPAALPPEAATARV